MRKYLAGLALGLFASASYAQSVVTFDVVFDTVYEASGAFTPNLTPIVVGAPGGPFSPTGGVAPSLTGTVTISAVPSATQIAGGTAVNNIVLNGSWSTQSGFSPSNGWSVHSYTNAEFDLYSQDPTPSYTYTEFVFPPTPTDWIIRTGTAIDGLLSDSGPNTPCPENGGFAGFGCFSTNPMIQFQSGLAVWNGASSNFPTLADAGWHPLVSGSYSQTNAGSGLGHDNGLDGFFMDTILDTNTNTIAPGGKVRIVMTSTSGNTMYVVEGTVVSSVIPVPAAVWLFGSALGLLGFVRRRVTV